MKIYRLSALHGGHDEFIEFTVYANSHQQAFDIAKKYAKHYESDYYFDDDVSEWEIEVVPLDGPMVIQDSVLYG